MTPVEFFIVRDTFETGADNREGFALGQMYLETELVCQTVEDEDRHMEDGNGKLYGKTAMPTGRYELELYNSPKHGWVPLFKNVPGFTFTEIHKANHAEELLGCVAVGTRRTDMGVENCAPALALIVAEMRQAKIEDRKVFCTIRRKT